MIKTLVNQAKNPIATIVFAHGAGAGQDSEFMQTVAAGLAGRQINVVRFNFAYMQLAEELGKRRPPDRMEKLLAHFETVLGQIDSNLPLFVGGKSMGGRVATMLLEQSPARGAICMGYPFHPPGKPEKLRTEHLKVLTKPILVLQGERDTFGKRGELEQYGLSNSVQITYLLDGDHSFKPRIKSGVSLEHNLQVAVDHTSTFIYSVIE